MLQSTEHGDGDFLERMTELPRGNLFQLVPPSSFLPSEFPSHTSPRAPRVLQEPGVTETDELWALLKAAVKAKLSDLHQARRALQTGRTIKRSRPTSP